MISIAGWLMKMLDDDNFKSFMKIIEESRDTNQKLALNDGNTDFIKGKYSALKWVSDLPQTIIEQSQQDADTTDTSS